MTTVTGPVFQFVEEIAAGQLHTIGGFGARTKPLLVKGALNRWPARHNWSFEQMAALRYKDGTQPVIQFQNGLVEQGTTRHRPHLQISPYLQELAAIAARPPSADTGLLPDRRRHALARDAGFLLDWSHMQSFTPDRMYLAQWNILDLDLASGFRDPRFMAWPALDLGICFCRAGQYRHRPAL